MNTIGLKIAAILTGFSLAGVIFFNVRRSNQDKRASAFIAVLDKHLKFSSGSLELESSLNGNYLEYILSKIESRVITLKQKVADDKAKLIADAWGFFNDDEDQINSVFRSLKDKVQVSQVAKSYQRLSNKSLLDVFNDRLNEKERKVVFDIISALPPYRVL